MSFCTQERHNRFSCDAGYDDIRKTRNQLDTIKDHLIQLFNFEKRLDQELTQASITQ